MDLYKEILDVISTANSFEFLSRELYLELVYNNPEERKINIARLGEIDFEPIKSNILRINLNQEKFKIFFDLKDFNKRISNDHIENDNFKFNIFILNKDSSDPILYLKDEFKVFVNFEKSENNFTFSNTINYFKLIAFLKEQDQENQENKHFYFIDHFNSDHRKIIVTSLKKEGKLTIGYSNEIPNFDPQISLQSRIAHFISTFQEKQLPKFIKAELFNILPKFKQEERLVAFIQNLDLITEKAEQNFEIYLSDLSLDNFKSQFLEFRLKYFNHFRDILSKITTQILTFPLSITAAAFATYKTIDSIFLCSLIVVAFIVFSVYSLFTLKAHKEDVNEIKKLFEADYRSFSTNSFFQKYPEELISFKETNSYIIKRSEFLILCINIYSWVLITTNFLFILFVTTQAILLKVSIVIVVIVLLLLLSLSIYYGVFK